MGTDCKAVRVREVHKATTNCMLKIAADDGREMVVTPDHLVTLSCRRNVTWTTDEHAKLIVASYLRADDEYVGMTEKRWQYGTTEEERLRFITATGSTEEKSEELAWHRETEPWEMIDQPDLQSALLVAKEKFKQIKGAFDVR